MNNKRIPQIIILCVTLFIPLSLFSGDKFNIKTASHISLATDRLERLISIPGNYHQRVTILIYHYTSGSEVLSYSGDEISTNTGTREMKLVLLLSTEKRITRALFFQIKASDDNTLMNNAAQKINRSL